MKFSKVKILDFRGSTLNPVWVSAMDSTIGKEVWIGTSDLPIEENRFVRLGFGNGDCWGYRKNWIEVVEESDSLFGKTKNEIKGIKSIYSHKVVFEDESEAPISDVDIFSLRMDIIDWIFV